MVWGGLGTPSRGPLNCTAPISLWSSFARRKPTTEFFGALAPAVETVPDSAFPDANVMASQVGYAQGRQVFGFEHAASRSGNVEPTMASQISLHNASADAAISCVLDRLPFVGTADVSRALNQFGQIFPHIGVRQVQRKANGPGAAIPVMFLARVRIAKHQMEPRGMRAFRS